ncbi:hypothetical protein HK102_010663, partial [Quaeritorhiza haematococci]
IRGIAAGLAVCGFGGGSIIAPFIQKALIGSTFTTTLTTNVGVPLTFVIIGCIYFVVMTLSAFVLRMPPPGYTVAGITIETIRGAEGLVVTRPLDHEKKDTSSESADAHTFVAADVSPVPVGKGDGVPPKNPFAMTLLESLASREFAMMYIMLFGAEITGLLIISKIQSIVQNQLGKDANTAATMNSILGRKPIFVISLIVQVAFLGALPTFINQRMYEATLASAFIIAFFYGGGFGVIPAFLADQFGSKNVGATHGMILTAWSAAGVFGGVAFNEILKSETTRLGKDNLNFIYNTNFYWILAIVVCALFVTLFIPV